MGRITGEDELNAGLTHSHALPVDLLVLAREKFDFSRQKSGGSNGALNGDHALDGVVDPEMARNAIPAAVLIGLIARPQGVCVLLTERATHLRAHSGQAAFPGGRIDPGDADPIAAALRETFEEVGVAGSHIEPFGQMAPYLSGSGYCITPIVAQIHTPFEMRRNEQEVAAIFEPPLAYLLDTAHHHRRERLWNGALRQYYEILWRDHRIWGVTAGILRQFRRQMIG